MDGMFSALVKNAAHIRTLSIICRWTWTDERLDYFSRALRQLNSLVELIIIAISSPHKICGEYRPIYRLLAEEGTHLQLRRLCVHHAVRPYCPLLSFLASQRHLKILDSLSFTPGRPITIPSTTVPELESLSMWSRPVVSAFVPGRPMSKLSFHGYLGDVSFFQCLERTSGTSLDLTVSGWGATESTYVEIIRILASIPVVVKSLDLDCCTYDVDSHSGLDALTSLETLTLWGLGGSQSDLPARLNRLPTSVRKV